MVIKKQLGKDGSLKLFLRFELLARLATPFGFDAIFYQHINDIKGGKID